MLKLKGLFTALITPFREDGLVNWHHIENLVNFQKEYGVDGLVPTGTTGESPVLSWDEHLRVVLRVSNLVRDKDIFVLAGTGSNATAEALEHSREAVLMGYVHGVLLVTCYYNRPSSEQLRRYYFEPIAQAVAKVNSDAVVVPYDIPSRTGCRFLDRDLLSLSKNYPNVCGIKDATGDLANMAEVRAHLGPSFSIMCGDDALTGEMMSRADIAGNGVISVMSNIFPGPMKRMVDAYAEGAIENGNKIAGNLRPVFELVGVTGMFPNEKYPNPCAVKAMMRVLGMDSGMMRPPLGPMHEVAVLQCREGLRKVYDREPAYFQPIADYFSSDIEACLFGKLQL